MCAARAACTGRRRHPSGALAVQRGAHALRTSEGGATARCVGPRQVATHDRPEGPPCYAGHARANLGSSQAPLHRPKLGGKENLNMAGVPLDEICKKYREVTAATDLNCALRDHELLVPAGPS